MVDIHMGSLEPFKLHVHFLHVHFLHVNFLNLNLKNLYKRAHFIPERKVPR